MDEQERNEFQEDDLERYGVWVKAGPEEVIEADEEFEFADLPPETDVEVGTDQPAEGEDEEFELPDIEDLDLDESDEYSIPQVDLEETPEDLSIDTSVQSIDGIEEDDDTLVSLDDLDLEEPDEDTDPFAVLGEDDSVGDTEESEADDFDLGELTEDLNELDDDYPELSPESGQSESFDSTIPGSDDELADISMDDISSDQIDTEELPELASEVEEEHDFTPDEQGIEIVNEGATNRITPDEEEFLASEEDLQNDTESAIPKTMDTQEREAFERIQHELSDIKRELAELKRALRTGGAPAPTAAPEEEEAESFTEPDVSAELDEYAEPEEPVSSIQIPEEGEESRGSGFFEEDEDETIALTGDELDNILNTAEFTEEAGEEEELDDDYIVPAPHLTDEDATKSDEESVDTSDEEGEIEPEEETPEPISEIEMEPVEDVFEEDPAVQELADMDIDLELSDIDSLEDETEEGIEDTSDEIEIDLDSLDEEIEGIEGTDESESEELESEEDDFDSFANAVQSDIAAATEAEEDGAVETEVADESDIESIDEIELNDDFDDELEDYTDTEEVEDQEDEEEIELNLDDLDVEDIDLDEGEQEDLEEPEAETQQSSSIADLPDDLKEEIRSVLSYMDQLLEALPDDKIEEFAKSEHFDVYKRLFEELGLET